MPSKLSLYLGWGLATVLGAVFGMFAMTLPAYAACSNPSPIPTGFAAPCPVFSLSATTVSQSQTLTLTATPQAGTDYILTIAHISNGSNWNPYTLLGNNAAPSYSSSAATLTLSSAQLSALGIGTHYAVVWDWLWDATAQCYKGPGLNQCNTGIWRLQSFSVTATYVYAQSAYYTYSQSAYYAYSQSAYYSYSQSAYTSAPVVSVSPTTLSFPSQQVGTTSAIQYDTLTNTGNATLTFISDSITGDFAFGGLGSCGAALSVGASCTYSAKFTPTATGTRTGTMTINDNASNTPQIIPLTGTGIMPTPTPSPSPCPPQCYVSTTGNDANPGTQAQPWLTIQKAANTVAAGTTVHVAAGTYTIVGSGGVGLTLATSGNSSARITYLSDTLWGAKIILNSGDNTSDPNVGIQTTGSWIDVIGFDITEGSNGKYRAGLVNTAGSNVRFIANSVHDLQNSSVMSTCNTWGGMGIGSFPGTTTDILGNYIYNIGNVTNTGCVFIHGVYMNSSGQIKNNIIFHNMGFGLNINRSGVDIANNTIFNQGAGGIFIDNSGGTWNAHHVNNNLIYNVGIGSSHQVGISYYYTSDAPADSSYTDNLIFQSSGTQANNWSTNGSASHTGDVAADPLFMNYTGDQTGDFHLKSTSPAINVGTSSYAPSTDFDGISRPQGAGFDIGAYEYH